jgi:hypothetical protein
MPHSPQPSASHVIPAGNFAVGPTARGLPRDIVTTGSSFIADARMRVVLALLAVEVGPAVRVAAAVLGADPHRRPSANLQREPTFQRQQ